MVEPVTIISGIVAAANSGVSILEKQGNGRKLNAEAAKTLQKLVLNGSNYEIWRKMMKALLISQNLWDVVEEGYKEKGRKAKKDRVLDSMALLIILQAVDQSVLRCTVRANTSKEAWNAIQDKYQVKTGPSMTGAAVGRIAQGTKILTEGGYEKVFRQTFETVPEEKLLKAYACYLSTSAGPVMGLLYRLRKYR